MSAPNPTRGGAAARRLSRRRSRRARLHLQAVFGALLSIYALGAPRPAFAAVVSGELMRWHRVEVAFDGPFAAESDSTPHPFLDYRLTCTFTAPSGRTLDVPGFFDADGAGGVSGTVWKCRLAPDEIGEWQYTAAFRTGAGIAVDDDAPAATALAPDGEAGSFTIAASDKAGDDFRAPGRGLLRNAGGHYLTFGGSGDTWIKAGMNIPENLFGYFGFDNTPNAIHAFAGHVQDWNDGDPDWNDGAGRGIIGALNYIAATGGNAVYFLPMNVGGDANDVFPTIAPDDKTHYDTSKLAQWEIVLEHADRLGIFLHLVLAEAGDVEIYHDGGELGTERKLYYRELIARFGHHLGIEWDLGEENNYGAARHSEFAAHIVSVDPYDHPVTTHTKFDQMQQYYGPLLGDPSFAMTAFQISSVDLDDEVAGWRQQSATAGVPWVISVDEPHAIENDPTDQSRGYPVGRRSFLWPTFISGGGGFEWYIKEDGGGDTFDQTIEDFRQAELALRWSGYAREFFERLPLATMAPAVGSCSPGCRSLGSPGEVYALYRSSGASLSVDLSAAPGVPFYYTWFDPEQGVWHTGGVLVGGAIASLGSPPFGGDVAAAVLRTDIAIERGFCVSDADCVDPDSCLTGATCNAGRCGIGTPDHAACDNGAFCDGAEVCDAATGQCLASVPVDCDDGRVCTRDVCDEAADTCAHEVLVTCDNGIFCDGMETCSAAGDCMAGAPVDCDDGIGCTADSCEEALATCIHVPDDAFCEDGRVCTDDFCQPSTGCEHVNNSRGCDDGIACTLGDICFSGVCLGGDACPLGHQCSLVNGVCEVADERIWIAAAHDTTALFSGTLTTGTRYSIGDDADPQADGLLGSSIYAAGASNDFSGSGGDEVTYTIIVPQTGSWYLWARMYYPGEPLSNDANSFFVRIDDGPPLLVGNKRDLFRKWHWDGNGSSSTGPPSALALGQITAGVHQLTVMKREVIPVAPRLDVIMLSPDTDPPTDQEAQAALAPPPTTTTTTTTTSTVVPGCASDAECSDGLFCNGAERCAIGGDCQPGVPPALGDGVGCTTDTCNEALDRVDHVPDDAACDDLDLCTDDVCNAATGCTYAPSVAVCDDGIACTTGDVCAGGTCSGTDACPAGQSCDAGSGSCVEQDVRVWIAAATDPSAAFAGMMTSSAEFAQASLVGLAAYADSSVASFSGGSPDHVTYDFDLAVAGQWYLWARLYYPGEPGSNAANSFWASVDGGVLLKLGNNREFEQQWHWDGDGEAESGPPVPLSLGTLSQGPHQLRIEKREVTPLPPRLDAILLTREPLVAPSDAEALLGLFPPTTTTTLAPTTTTTLAPTTTTSTTTTMEPACTSDVDCSDGLFCNGAERCLAGGVCGLGAPPSLDDGIACTVDACDEGADRIDHVPENSACDDGDVCTNDVCLVPFGCVHQPNSAACDDGLACTLGDICSGGVCIGGDACPIRHVCSGITGQCEEVDLRVWVPAATYPSAEFSGAMTTSPAFALGDDSDPAADSLVGLLVHADTSQATFSGGTPDHVVYTIEVPEAGQWYLWARMYYPGAPGSNDANSFLASVDGGPFLKLGNNKDFYGRWHWDGDGSVEVGAPVSLPLGFLSAGLHELRIEKREVTPVPPRIDVLVLAPDAGPAPTDAETVIALAPPPTTITPPSTTTTLPATTTTTLAAATTTTLAATTTTTLPATTTTTLLPGCQGDAECSDGLFCNGAERCLVNGDCAPGTAPTLDDGVTCTVDVCSEIFDRVDHLPDDAACSDGNPCTDDVCDVLGDCTNVFNAAPCDDGVACTAGDICSLGVCTGGDTCPAGLVCNLSTGACDVPDRRLWIDAAGDAAATFAGLMTASAELALGTDADPLLDSLLPVLVYADSVTNDFAGTSGDEVSYDVVLPESGQWYLWARMYYPGQPGSNDANSFYVEVDGGGDLILGNDGSRFRQWHWDGAGGGSAVPLGTLLAGPHTLTVKKREVSPVAPRIDVIVLTPDSSLVPSDAAARTALGLGLIATTTLAPTTTVAPTTSTTLPPECVVDVDCDDGAVCNGSETCTVAGDCTPGLPVVCDDGVFCTADLCSESTGGCVHVPVDPACDNGAFCDGVESCDAATGCVAGIPVDAGDGIACTLDLCDETTDEIVHVVNHGVCDDGNPCTADACDPVQDCLSLANTLPCDDGDACTSDDTCSAGACAGTPSCVPATIAIDPASIASRCGPFAGDVLRVNNVTVGSQPDRILVVTAGAYDDESDCDFGHPQTSVTYAGLPLTHAVSAVSGPTADRVCNGIFYLLAPPSGTDDVFISLPDDAGNAVKNRQAGAYVIYNAAQQAPEAVAFAAADDTTNPVSTDVNVVTEGAWVIDVMSQHDNGFFTPLMAGQTQRWQAVCDVSGSTSSTRAADLAGVTAMAWQHNDPRRYAHSLAVFAPVILAPSSVWYAPHDGGTSRTAVSSTTVAPSSSSTSTTLYGREPAPAR